MSSSDPSSPQDLKYPPVRVNHSLTTLDLDTLMMRSTTRRLPEEPGSSLDDSTYELLGDSILETSDDEAHTESIASTDGPTPDDTSDFSDDDSVYESGHRDVNNSIHSSQAGATEQYPALHPMASGEDSTLTEVPPHMEGSETSRKIKLQEQPTEGNDVISGSKVIKSVPNDISELPQVMNRYGCSQVRLVVRAALSQRPIPTPESYRILYIGMPEKWMEDAITSQIGATLAASPSVSRSVMVRGGQIEPYGPVIHVYHCAELHTFAEHEKQSHVLIILDDGTQLKFGPGLTSHLEDKPDLVVFCHPTVPGSATDIQEFASAGEVFGRESIPCINLAKARPYGDGANAYDSKSLRVCVEGRDDSDTDYELKEVLPLDYFTFSELDPAQLNRHLALISPHLFPEADTNTQMPRRSFVGDTCGAFVKTVRSQWRLIKMLIPLMVVFALVPACLQGTAYAPILLQKPLNGEIHSSISVQHPVMTPSIASTILTSQTGIAVSPIPSVRSAARDLTLVPPQAKPLKRASEKKDGKVDGFDIQASGDHQFVLRPSKGFASNRKTPQLQIQVSCESKAVRARYNRTMSGEYVVDLEQTYPVSTFNVSIRTYSKPLLRQSFQITLGQDKSRLAQLFDTAKLNFITIRNNLENTSYIVSEQLRAGYVDLEAAIRRWTNEVGGPGEEAVERLRIAKETIQRNVAISTGLLSQVPGATWIGLRQLTAPVRTSSPMLRARMNALRLRCKMEIAAGLSSENLGEKQSWACNKVQSNSQEGDQR
ncbi:Nn.00g002230.m01.CDS01 [Neocucurbitaria sp. VM-36]